MRPTAALLLLHHTLGILPYPFRAPRESRRQRISCYIRRKDIRNEASGPPRVRTCYCNRSPEKGAKQLDRTSGDKRRGCATNGWATKVVASAEAWIVGRKVAYGETLQQVGYSNRAQFLTLLLNERRTKRDRAKTRQR